MAVVRERVVLEPRLVALLSDAKEGKLDFGARRSLNRLPGQQSRGLLAAVRLCLMTMETELTPCRLCIELERHLHSAQQPDAPDLLPGLTEAGKRNRMRQQEERLLKAELELERHRKSAHSA